MLSHLGVGTALELALLLVEEAKAPGRELEESSEGFHGS